MQRFRALQGDYDVTICVPPLLGEMLLNAVGEEVCHLHFLAGESFVIRRAQFNHIMVAREQSTPGEFTELQLSFSLECLGDLLRDDLSAEHACEAVANNAFEPALEALHEAHDNPLHTSDSCAPSYLCQRAGTSPSSQQVVPPT
ncbi:hypothetical protein GCM10027563_20450 [Parasphingorhabdus pacifica]